MEIVREHYIRFAVCAFFGFASVGIVNMLELRGFVRLLLSVALFLGWMILGLVLQFLHSRRKEKE